MEQKAQQQTVNMASGELQDETDSDPSQCLRIQKILSRLSHLFSSQLGLICILLIYSFIGAAIFQAIEEKNEFEQLEENERTIERGRRLLVNISRDMLRLRLDVSPQSDVDAFWTSTLKQYKVEFDALLKNASRDDNPVYREWDFWGSLLFCATVYTTIGYGHIAPRTSLGRVVCVVYAIVGIPLCLVALANLGRLLTTAIKFLWSFCRRFYYTGQCRRIRKSVPLRAMALRHSVEDKLDMRCDRPDSVIQPHQSRWLRLRKRLRRTFCRCWHRCWNVLTCQKVKKSDVEKGASSPSVGLGGGDRLGSGGGGGDEVSVIDEFLVDDEFNLPPVVAILITFVYIFFGAAMYTIWESWTFLEAFYFIFISISTIGFGDVIPHHPKYFLCSSIYIIVGLSLVAMVINVIMVAFHDTIKKAKEKALDTLDRAKDHLDETFDLALDKVKDVGSKMAQSFTQSMESLNKIGEKKVVDFKRRRSVESF